MKPTARALLAASLTCALAACSEQVAEPEPELCSVACLSNQVCVDGDRCECKPGHLDCDKLAENGCEVTGSSCQACKPESEVTFCARGGKNCGSYTATDNCGQLRTAECGSCIEPAVCGLSTPNVCGQPAVCESEAAFCARYGKNCGSFTGTDDCGQSRTAACGSCTLPATCGGGGNSNVCGRPPCETDAAFCARYGKNCGSYTATDNCDQSRTADCGTCTTPDTCGGSGVANVCGQQATCETDAAFCARNGRNCGSFTGTDDCGQSRTAECGECQSPTTCGGGGTDNVCGCTGISDLDYCMDNGLQCGLVEFTDNCGAERSVWCGSCGMGLGCVDNACVPDGVAEDQSCVYSGQVLTCASPMVCISNGGQGADKIGVCKRKCTSTSQCRPGETCTLGQTGNPVEGICATPATEGEACASFFGSPNFCWDANKPQGSMLDCLGSVCRYICTWDSNPNPPLPCPNSAACGIDHTVYPEYPMWIAVCESCTPETDEAFCSRLEKDCDDVSTADNCGVGRTVNCGVCDGECGGWGEPNVCAPY